MELMTREEAYAVIIPGLLTGEIQRREIKLVRAWDTREYSVTQYIVQRKYPHHVTDHITQYVQEAAEIFLGGPPWPHHGESYTR